LPSITRGKNASQNFFAQVAARELAIGRIRSKTSESVQSDSRRKRAKIRKLCTGAAGKLVLHCKHFHARRRARTLFTHAHA